ncbi:MAG: hypothetical protein ACKOOF_04430 [Planctomycetaceae bacterium]
MLPGLTARFAIRGFLAVAAATLVSLPDTASALPRDRVTARRLARILPPGSTLTVPATPVPPRRPAIVRGPASPAAAKPSQPSAATSGVQQAAGTTPATKTATPTGAWTLDDASAADGTKSVLVPSGPQPTPAEPIELLPTP